METRTLTLAGDAPDRLDRMLAAAIPDLSRSRLQALIRAGHVAVDGAPARDPSAKAAPGATVRLDEPPPAEGRPRAEPISLAVVYEDAHLLVIDKPAGLVVHPGAGNPDGTLVNALLAHCGDSLSGIGGVIRPGIVHRLDKDTSGLLVVAKTDAAHRGLSDQFADHGRTGPLERAYLAFVWGAPNPARGSVDAALARSARDREKMAVVSAERGRAAITRYAVEETFAATSGDVAAAAEVAGTSPEAAASLVRCTLETGRTHQIRVHLAHIKHPLIGDEVYGSGFRTKRSLLSETARDAILRLGRQALHATWLAFEHPVTGEIMRFESPPPEDLAALHAALAGRTTKLPPS